MIPAIDAHNHFWTYTPADYPWIGRGMETIKRDFFPADLQREIEAAEIEGTVAVQARQTLEETEWLLALAAENQFVRGVVGWVPLFDAAASADLERLSMQPALKGVRHIVHDEPDDFFILRDDFNRGVEYLKRCNLVYDLLIFERHLPQTIEFVDRHPNQPFVLDHIAKPKIRANELSPWRERIVDLARRKNVVCKISGMVTEASWTGWKRQDLEPYFETVLSAFGPDRLMFGSDWPVLLVAGSYTNWVETVRASLAALSSDEQAQIMGGTAARVYAL